VRADAWVHGCARLHRLGKLPQECGALIMGFLDGKDLWSFVSSSKRWRKISDEVLTQALSPALSLSLSLSALVPARTLA
jgi:hypothetical protein